MQLNSREDAEQFDRQLAEYSKSRGQTAVHHFPLATGFEICRLRFGPRVFAALVDLRINSTLVSCDLLQVLDLWQSSDAEASRDLLVNGNFFLMRMRIHRLLSGATLRYRALWDKFFDLILMLRLKPVRSREESDRIIKKSGMTEHKKQLRKLLRQTPMSADNLLQVYEYLQRFDKRYRTPEAHLAGGNMYRWTLSADRLDASPFQEFLLDAWKLWNDAEVMLGRIFSEESLAALREDLERHQSRQPKLQEPDV